MLKIKDQCEGQNSERPLKEVFSHTVPSAIKQEMISFKSPLKPTKIDEHSFLVNTVEVNNQKELLKAKVLTFEKASQISSNTIYEPTHDTNESCKRSGLMEIALLDGSLPREIGILFFSPLEETKVDDRQIEIAEVGQKLLRSIVQRYRLIEVYFPWEPGEKNCCQRCSENSHVPNWIDLLAFIIPRKFSHTMD